MERRLRKAVASWLQAERGPDPNRSEAALRRAFLRLPPHAFPVGFSALVLARLGFRSRLPLAIPGWRVAVGLCLVLAASATVALPGFVGALWTGLGPGKLIDLGAGLLVALSTRLAESMTVWGALADAFKLVSANFASPTMMALVAAAALVSATALRLLHGLLIPERNARHAQPS